MPKVTIDPMQRKNELIGGIIDKYAVGRKSTEIAAMAGIGKSTYYEHRKHPEKFTLGQIRKLCKRLGIPAEEMREMLL